MPPDISAFEPTYLPNSLPKQMPAAENKKVINPISHEASMIGTFKQIHLDVCKGFYYMGTPAE